MTQAPAHTSPVPEAMLPRPFQVVSTYPETPDTQTVVLEGLDEQTTDFAPGQFMMMYIYGIGEVPLSIAGNPWTPGTLTHTVRAVGAVTEAICGLQPDDVVGIRGPFGSEWPLDEAVGRDLIIVAGGIGLAPLRPAVIKTLVRRTEFASLSVLYGARTPQDLLYKDDLLGWEASEDVNVEVTVDRTVGDWWGDVGLVTKFLPRTTFEPANTTAMICGPEVMMRVVARDLRDMGVPNDALWISLERNMKCGVGFCGHCQYGSDLLCKVGPVVPFTRFAQRLMVDEL